jgi:hypothetical protein
MKYVVDTIRSEGPKMARDFESKKDKTEAGGTGSLQNWLLNFSCRET